LSLAYWATVAKLRAVPTRQALAVIVCLLAGCASSPDGTEASSPYDPTVCGPGKRVLQNDIVNARDLGGVPLELGTSTRCGALFRGPPLAPLSQAGCAHVAELGIRTIIDLRTLPESDAKPEAACVTSSVNRIVAPLPVPYNVSPSDYIADLNTLDSMVLAFAALGDDAAYPIYFHCTWGRDRTGVLAAVILLALGATRENILDEYMLSSGSVGAYPDSLRATLDEIDRQGGVNAYLDSLGVTPEQRTTLRTHAIALPPTL
jgi:hypothetical protein